MLIASWVIVSKATGKAICETYSQRFAAAINRDKYDVVPAGEWLGKLNKAVRDAA
jgi:hypothetical protein